MTPAFNGLRPHEAVAAKRAAERDAKSNKPRIYLLVGQHGLIGGVDVIAAYATLDAANKALARMSQKRVDEYDRVLVQRLLVRP